MQYDSLFFLNSILFGIDLAVHPIIKKKKNRLHFPKMRIAKTVGIAAVFSIFQMAAPMIGWAIAHAAFVRFAWIEICFAWLAVAVLAALGVKMLAEARKSDGSQDNIRVGICALIAQCAATSVDALTVGFTIEEYKWTAALACSAIIASVTFTVYIAGFAVGRKFGMRFERVASIIGGLVFLAIAAEILVTTYI